MKKVLLLSVLFISICSFGQPLNIFPIYPVGTKMEVKQSNIKIDEAYYVVLNNVQSVEKYLNEQISISEMSGDKIRAQKLIKLKRGLFESLRVFRNTAIDSTIITYEVDSLQTVNRIKQLTIDINKFKTLKSTCLDCDTITIGRRLFELKNEKNRLVKQTKNWTVKK